MIQKKGRFFELDLIRSFAIVGMVIYHLLFDLTLIFSVNIPVESGLLLYLARATAITFLVLVGISLVIYFDSLNGKILKKFRGIFKRSLFILFFAYLITFVTSILFPNESIEFGILHLIGFSMLLSFPFLIIKSKILPIISAMFIAIISILIKFPNSNNLVFIPFGVYPQNFASLDYFPIIPWFTVILIGVFIGKIYHPWRLKQNLFAKCTKTQSFLQFTGQNSLLIYLIHQPIIYSVLLSIKLIIQK